MHGCPESAETNKRNNETTLQKDSFYKGSYQFHIFRNIKVTVVAFGF